MSLLYYGTRKGIPRRQEDVIIEPPQSTLADYPKGCKGNCHQGNPGSGLVTRADGRHSEGTSDQCRAVHRPWGLGDLDLGTWEPWKSEWITRGPHPFQNLRISSNSSSSTVNNVRHHPNPNGSSRRVGNDWRKRRRSSTDQTGEEFQPSSDSLSIIDKPPSSGM